MDGTPVNFNVKRLKRIIKTLSSKALLPKPNSLYRFISCANNFNNGISRRPLVVQLITLLTYSYLHYGIIIDIHSVQMVNMRNPLSKSIVFITGAFISHACWHEWIVYFETEGYNCIAPAWPHKDAPAQELRNRPVDDPIALNTMASLTDHFAAVVSLLPERPILVGHSLGGLVVQLLLQKGVAVAGIAIHSFPPQGVSRFRLSFLKAVWETMVLFTSGSKIYMMSYRKWKHAVANGLTCEQQKDLYYRYAIPESKKIIRDVFKCVTQADFKKARAPLLLTSGGNDKLVPASMNFGNYKRYADNNSITDYRKFKGLNHLVFGHAGWKKEAEFILYWLQGLQ